MLLLLLLWQGHMLYAICSMLYIHAIFFIVFFVHSSTNNGVSWPLLLVLPFMPAAICIVNLSMHVLRRALS